MVENEKYCVEGMTCASCSSHVDKAVRKVRGVKDVTVNLLTNSMIVTYDTPANHIAIEKAVSDSGYKAYLEKENKNKGKIEDTQDNETKKLLKILIFSFIFLVPLFYISMGSMMGWNIGVLDSHPFLLGIIELIISSIIMLINKRFFIFGTKALIYKAPNMDTLVALGAGVSYLYSILMLIMMSLYVHMGMTMEEYHQVMHYSMNLAFETSGMVPTLITIGKTLESYSKGKTTSAIKSLINLAPKKACVIKDNKEEIVDVEEVKIDDILLVKPGESIPVDGIIIDGITSINESALTGESMPVDKTVGDKVSQATININGVLKIKATRVGNDTTLKKIIELVKNASSTKTKISRIADKVSGVFVPVIMSIAVIVFIFWFVLGKDFVTNNVSNDTTLTYALSKGVSILVIACPCALGLATPVAIMVGSGKGAKNGILFKTASALEETGKVDFVVLDKTGTITKGQPEVRDIISNDKDNLLKIAYGLEKNSEHPLSKAIVNKAKELSVENIEMSDVQAIPGKGIKGIYNGITYYAGNSKLMSEHSLLDSKWIDVSNEISNNGKTPLFFASEKEIIGIISVSDVIKDDSKKAIEEFKKMGVTPIMLTGDNRLTASAIASEIGIEYFVSDVLPSGKQEVIKELQKYGKVLMVGDGINDAIALTQADIGMAIGAGSDIAIDSANVVLMKSSLLDCSASIRLSRHTLTNIKENLFWAFFYNIIMIPIAAGVFSATNIEWLVKMKPWYGAAAMAFSSVSVCLNALRINLFNIYNVNKDKKHKTIKLPKDIFKENKNELDDNNTIISIDGMMCDMCVKHVKTALNFLENINVKEVSLEKNQAIISGDIKEDKIKEVIEKAGYKVKNIYKEREVNKMTKTLKIEGMMCKHCVMHVEEALKKVDGVTSVKVSLENKNAVVELSKDVDDSTFKEVIEKAGYEMK